MPVPARLPRQPSRPRTKQRRHTKLRRRQNKIKKTTYPSKKRVNCSSSLKKANEHRNEWFEGVHKCKADESLFTVMERIVKAEVDGSLIAPMNYL